MQPETIQELDTKTVHISKLNTRRPKKGDCAELIETIKHSGQITPAVVRPHPDKPGHYELAAGARRKVSCEALKIPLRAIVREIPDDEFEDIILIDNLQREDPDPMAEARLIERRIAAGAAPSEIAAKYGKSETWLKRRMKLAGLTAKARDAWAEGENFSHYTTEMMEYVGTLSPAQQDELVDDSEYDRVFSLKELIADSKRQGHSLEGVDWLHDPVSFVDGCGPGCATNDAESLFPDPDHACGTCLNGDCFRKRAALIQDAKMLDLLDGKAITDFILFRSEGYDNRFHFQGQELKILTGWQFKQAYTKLKKAGPGTLLGIDVEDPAKPVIRHLKAKAGTQDNSSASSTPVGKKESREDRLTGKRLAAINEYLDNEISEAPVPEGTPMLRLAAAFGMSDRRTWPDHEDDAAWTSLDSKGEVPSFGYSSGTTTPEDTIWRSIRPILRQRIQFTKNSDLLSKHKLLEMQRCAILIGFDYQAHWLKVCEEVPVPKSWGPGIDPITLESTTMAQAVEKEMASAKKKIAAKKKAKNKAA